MSMVGNVEWWRERNSTPQAPSRAGFQDQRNSQFRQLSARRNALTFQDSNILSRQNFLFKGWFRFATSRPERVDKLVLLTPGGIVPDRISFALRAIPLSFLGRWGIERIIRMVFGPQPIPTEVNDATMQIMTHFKPRIGVLPIFSDEELRRLTMPTLLLIGQEDTLRDARKVAERMRKLVPELTTKIIPQAGHALYNTPSHIMPFLAATERA